MVNHFIGFFKNKDGSLSVEFAGIFFLFIMLLYVIYDIYASISLQNKLEGTTYSSASVFRERTALYPLFDDSIDHLDPASSLCLKNNNSCFKSYEIITQQQVDELRDLASTLLGKEIAVKVDALFLLQDTDPDKASSLPDTQKIVSSFTSCPNGECNDDINSYLSTLPDMTDTSSLDYTRFMPFVNRDTTYSGTFAYPDIIGRWVTLYRVNMCVVNEESLYLKLFNGRRESESILPNLCSDVVVLSRCNDISDPTEGCPIYIK